jgi:glycine/serine hydroxymethyltransferase
VTCAEQTLTGVDVKEKKRQKHFINLIPSENFTSQAVLDALGSPMQSSFFGPLFETSLNSPQNERDKEEVN